MSDTRLTLTRELGGVEDLLLDANYPNVVTQARLVGDTVQDVTVHKINLETFPVEGKYGDSNFKSLKDLLDYMNESKLKRCAIDDSGIGLCITIGDADEVWDDGAPASNEFAIAQVSTNGHYRWIGKGTIGSDDFHFRGKVSGIAGINSDDFIIKAQLDALEDYVNNIKSIAETQSDWNEVDTNSPAYIKHKPTIEQYSYATMDTAGVIKCGDKPMLDAGTDTTCRGWSAKDLKDFSEANSGGDELAGKLGSDIVIYTPSHVDISYFGSQQKVVNTNSYDIVGTLEAAMGTSDCKNGAGAWGVISKGNYTLTIKVDYGRVRVWKNGSQIYYHSKGANISQTLNITADATSTIAYAVDYNQDAITGICYGYSFKLEKV